MEALPVVIIVNYHRIGPTDPDNPLHRLHGVGTEVFREQFSYMQAHGRLVSLEDIRQSRLLDAVNFAVTFDDVPIGACSGINLMEACKAPYALSVCGQLAADGWGTRDKVYSIIKYLDAAEITEFVRRQIPSLPDWADMPFYYLTKNPALRPDVVRDQLIDPLFSRVDDQAAPYLSGAYISWGEIRDRFADNPLATLADHTWQHNNLAACGRQEINADIRKSHDRFTRETGRKPLWFTVPFGRFTQQLAADLINPLQQLGYHGVLWVGDAGNAIRGTSSAQISQLIRLHAPETIEGFIQAVRGAAENRLDAAIRQVPIAAHNRAVRIVASSEARPALNFEMLMRQGKDYSSDLGFYRYQFTGNPYKGNRPDYYAATCDGRIEATAYNFHSSFSVHGQEVPGVYIASWRRLPEAHRAASGLLIRRMTDQECVVGVYKPSKQVEHVFRDWHGVAVYRHAIPVPMNLAGLRPLAPQYRVISHTGFNLSLSAMARRTTCQAGFTVTRDAAYYAWRFDTYPLAEHRYFQLLREGAPAGYCVVLWHRHELSIADFSVEEPADTAQLVSHSLAFARARGINLVTLETSSPAVSRYLSAIFGTAAELFRNYYYLNGKLLAARAITTDARCLWDESSFHETAATGDVLLR
jgi:peptidoglycan/xylan/chitin deacetylase (PgdA/CDA1 family)